MSAWPRAAEDAGSHLLPCLKDYPRLRAASWFRGTQETSVLYVSPEQTYSHWVIYSRIRHLNPFPSRRDTFDTLCPPWFSVRSPLGKAKRPQPTQITTGNEGRLRMGEIVFCREEHTNWFPNPKCSALRNMYTQVTLYRPSRLYLGKYVYAYTL